MTRMLDDMIRQKVEEDSKREKDGEGVHGRTSSLNLLAMREVPAMANKKRAGRIPSGPEGLGITTRQTQADPSSPIINGLGSRQYPNRLGQHDSQREDGRNGVAAEEERAVDPETASARQAQAQAKTAYTNSTSAALQATEALRNFSGHRNGVGESIEEEGSGGSSTDLVTGADTKTLRSSPVNGTATVASGGAVEAVGASA